MRRGAAWPLAERPSSCLTAAKRQFRALTQAASPPSLHGTPSTAGAVRRNLVRRPSGHPLGVVAQDIRSWPCLVSLSGPQQCPVSGVRCPVSCVRCPRVRCPRDRRPASGCPLSGVGVRCPVSSWASGPLGIRRPLSGRSTSAVSEPGEFVKRADAASSHTAKTAGVGVVTPHGIHDRLVVCPSRSLTLEAGAGRAGPTEASAWPWSSGGPRPAAGLDRLAHQEEPVAQGPLVGREPGTRRGSPTCGMAGRRSSGT